LQPLQQCADALYATHHLVRRRAARRTPAWTSRLPRLHPLVARFRLPPVVDHQAWRALIVAGNDVIPIDFAHPHLFVPKPKPSEPQVAGSEAEASARFVAATTSPTATWPEMVVPMKRTGHVAVFVSRKEKKIFVRQGFAPLFDTPVTIDDPDLPLGTHVFTAMEVTNNGTSMRWNVMTMPGEEPRIPEPSGRKKMGKHAIPTPKPFEAKATTTPQQALDRIHIPQEVIDRIGELLMPGSSLVVSDQGLGPETGTGTDFIVVTP